MFVLSGLETALIAFAMIRRRQLPWASI
jgi:hypothetical protein